VTNTHDHHSWKWWSIYDTPVLYGNHHMWILTSAKFRGIQIVASEYLHVQLQISCNYKIHAEFKCVFVALLNCITILRYKWILKMQITALLFRWVQNMCTIWIQCVHKALIRLNRNRHLHLNVHWCYMGSKHNYKRAISKCQFCLEISTLYCRNFSVQMLCLYIHRENPQFWTEIYILKISQ
jgi:hypothetical protein